MNKRLVAHIRLLAIVALALTASCRKESKASENGSDAGSIQEPTSIEAPANNVPADTDPRKAYPLGVQALLDAYPDFVTDYDAKSGSLIFKDGSTMPYDDGKEKSFETMLDNSSPKDMFYVAYSIPGADGPAFQADAGRSRSEPLFKKMYGSSQSEASRKLVPVKWFGGNVRFTSANGADKQLAKVAAELEKHPELSKYLKSSGTFYWRNVRGADRLSAHSYGIAIDIGVSSSDYWQWRNPGAKESTKIGYRNRIPVQIAEIFQKYGFIWGGAWYHYDTMHFEYRPEILRYAELVAEQGAKP